MSNTIRRLRRSRARALRARQGESYLRHAVVEVSGETPENIQAARGRMDPTVVREVTPEQMIRWMEARGLLAPPEVRAQADIGDVACGCPICEALLRSGHDPDDCPGIIRL